MDEEAEKFRQETAAVRARGAAGRFSDAMREQAVSYAMRRQAEGATFDQVVAALGVSDPTLRRWMATSKAMATARRSKRAAAAARTPKLVPVQVRAGATEVANRPSTPGLTVVAPGGYRVEGLDVAQAVALLRGLS